MKLELKPCPFCGGEASFDHDDNGWNWIYCKSCDASTNARVSAMDDCRPLLAEAWNRSALLAKYSEQVGKCSEHHAKCSEVVGYAAEDMASAAAQGFRDGVKAASNVIAKLEQEATNDTPEPCQHGSVAL